jgi:hypothetical protein
LMMGQSQPPSPFDLQLKQTVSYQYPDPLNLFSP